MSCTNVVTKVLGLDATHDEDSETMETLCKIYIQPGGIINVRSCIM